MVKKNDFQDQNAPIWPLTSLWPWFELSAVASTLAHFVISHRTILAWMPSINKKCHQNVFLSIVQIMPGWLLYKQCSGSKRFQTVRLRFDHMCWTVYNESDAVWLSIKLISIKQIHRKNQTDFQVNKYRRDNFLCLCLREKYQDHISYFHSVHTSVSDGFTTINFSRIYTERQKSCTTVLIVILFQTMAFENNELPMNRQVISMRFYASAVKLSSVLWRNSQKCLKHWFWPTNQINRISVENFGCFVSVWCL